MSQLIRTFIAIEIPDPVRRQIDRLLRKIRPLAESVKWVSPKNVHITLKFFGEIPPMQIRRIKQKLESTIEESEPFQLHFKQIGAFPNFNRPRTLWTGIQGNEKELIDLKQRLDGRLETIGFEKESKPFHPHLTLGRVRHGRNPLIDIDALERQFFRSDNFTVKRVVLMKSELQKFGPIYTPQAVYILSDKI